MNKRIVITGCPKSGTSYLCALLHNFSNSVMLTEPPLLDAMHKDPGAGIKELFDMYHNRVLKKQVVPNSIKEDGTLVGDPRTENKLRTKVKDIHKFDNEDFVFGIKNPQFFMLNLPFIHKHMPEAKVVVIVRNPYDTVGSLRRFGGPGGQGMGKVKDYYEKHYGLKIAELVGPVKWWAFWAEVTIRHLDEIILVRYQDAVLKPKETIDRVFGDWNPGKPTRSIMPSEIRYSRDCMKPGDKEEVEKYCKENAKLLGIW